MPAAVSRWLADAGLGGVRERTPLSGGEISRTERLTTDAGATVILKRASNAPGDLYRREADGLEALRAVGAVPVPEVLLVGDDFLLLADAGSAKPSGSGWVQFGRALARQHERVSPFFGYDHDNYLGVHLQRNPRTADGHEFFIQHRVLRFLESPIAGEALTTDDRRLIERFAERLRDLIPAQPASLLHGDLWLGNMLAAADGAPVAIDPAVHYGWAEAELSMARQCGGVPDEFFEAYGEVRPLADGWRERLRMLHVRELLSRLAHGHGATATVAELRELASRYARGPRATM